MSNSVGRLEPRWLALLALLGVGSLRVALPETLSAGPGWLLLAVVAALIEPTVWLRFRGPEP
jgi:hypothetical protein